MHASSRFADFLSRVVVFALVGCGVAAVFIWYLPLIQKNQILRTELAVQDAHVQQLREDIASMKHQLALYRGDSNTVERLLRENFGYARPGEYVIRFDDKGTSNAPDAAH